MRNETGLEHVIGVQEASKLWGLSPITIKDKCAKGKIISKKIGTNWAIDKNQPNPREREPKQK